MDDALLPHPPRQPAPHSRQLLREIADVLGVSVEALVAGPSARLFHIDADATQWFLVEGDDGLPAVREVSSRVDCHATVDQPISAFLSQNIGTAQGDALAAFINQLLLASMR